MGALSAHSYHTAMTLARLVVHAMLETYVSKPPRAFLPLFHAPPVLDLTPCLTSAAMSHMI